MHNYERQERKAYIRFIVALLNGCSTQTLRKVIEYILGIYDR